MLRLSSSLLKGFHNNETNNKDKEENVFSNLAALEKKQVVQIIDSCSVRCMLVALHYCEYLVQKTV
jgi:hypothetical protein